MSILVFRDQAAAKTAAATLIAAQVLSKHESRLLIPGVPMAEGVYARLCSMTGAGVLDWSGVRFFQQSEFIGAPPEDPNSHSAFLRRHFYSKINCTEKHIRPLASSLLQAPNDCQRFEDDIFEAGELDIALVCPSRSGSIAYNVPANDFRGVTHIATLTDQDAQEEAERLPPQFQRQAITAGIGTITSAKRLIVLACGMEYKEAVRRMTMGKISSQFPASIFQLHNNATFLFDQAAAESLQ